MAPLVIGISGPSGSGKSFAAHHLVERHGFQRTRFAEPLKAMLRALGCSEEEIEGARKESPSAVLCGRTPREAMQLLGTEWGRDLIAPDLWVEAWRRTVADLREREPRVRIVVDDVRFLNECAAIWALGGAIWRIDRAAARTPSAPTHVSETQPFGCDLHVGNDGDEEACRAALDAALLK